MIEIQAIPECDTWKAEKCSTTWVNLLKKAMIDTTTESDEEK